MFNLECSANDFLIKHEKQFKKSSRMYFGFNLLDHRGKLHLYQNSLLPKLDPKIFEKGELTDQCFYKNEF